jgi:general secretion pathway protein A
MSYYQALGLTAEPFSTSPDPAFFYLSKGHKAALYRLRIALGLKRGMCVVVGDVGTGKTTLSRKLSQVLREEPDTALYMILNPYFKSQKQFLTRLASIFHVDVSPKHDSGLDCIEAIEQFLFKKGVEERKTVVLLIDEAQLLPDYVLEILRILLNYETNEYKILQLILLGQLELVPRISRLANFWDRIALKCMLKPLDLAETREMIEFRLRQAGAPDHLFFSGAAIEAIHANTQGYPRRLSLLCHNSLEALVMQDRKVVDEQLVRDLIARDLRRVEEEDNFIKGVPDVVQA